MARRPSPPLQLVTDWGTGGTWASTPALLHRPPPDLCPLAPALPRRLSSANITSVLCKFDVVNRPEISWPSRKLTWGKEPSAT